YAEAAGFVKFDLLSLKTLTMIHDTCLLIKQQGKGEVKIKQIPLTDSAAFELLSQGKTVGIFQFEGVGMREAIKGLKPDSFEDLIALASLYRPGPMENIPHYINRKHG